MRGTLEAGGLVSKLWYTWIDKSAKGQLFLSSEWVCGFEALFHGCSDAAGAEKGVSRRERNWQWEREREKEGKGRGKGLPMGRKGKERRKKGFGTRDGDEDRDRDSGTKAWRLKAWSEWSIRKKAPSPFPFHREGIEERATQSITQPALPQAMQLCLCLLCKGFLFFILPFPYLSYLPLPSPVHPLPSLPFDMF